MYVFINVIAKQNSNVQACGIQHQNEDIFATGFLHITVLYFVVCSDNFINRNTRRGRWCIFGLRKGFGTWGWVSGYGHQWHDLRLLSKVASIIGNNVRKGLNHEGEFFRNHIAQTHIAQSHTQRENTPIPSSHVQFAQWCEHQVCDAWFLARKTIHIWTTHISLHPCTRLLKFTSDFVLRHAEFK